MKIICTDNFGRDTVDDRLVATNISYKRCGDIMVRALNDHELKTTVDFYRLVEDDYKLYEFKL